MRTLWFSALVSLSFVAEAQIFACKDLATGKTNYTEAACPGKTQSRLVVPARTPEQISMDRRSAYEAQQRAYRPPVETRISQHSNELGNGRPPVEPEIASNAPPPAPRGPNGSWSCRMALRDIDIASSSGSQTGDDRVHKVNGAILSANQACGTDTPLVKLPDVTNVNVNNFHRWP